MKYGLRIRLVLIGSLIVWLLPAALGAVSLAELIEADIDAGLISKEEGIIYQALAATNPGYLPEHYQLITGAPDKSATILVRDAWVVLAENLDLAAKYRGVLGTRPLMQTQYQSPAGQFWLHYDTSGTHAVPAADTNVNQVPDYIERAAQLADSVYNYQVNVLGYLPPPSDGTLGGGQDQYDIYFQLMPYYGYTSPELAGPAPWDDYSSHIVVSCNFEGFPPNDDPEGQQIGALKVAIAHEFFHAVQFAYNVHADSYFMEMSSVWMEEMAFPEVNDNYQYLHHFFDDPQEGLQHDGQHRYASFIWPKYLEENFGIDIMRAMWCECRYEIAFSSMAYVLDSIGTAFPVEYLRFLDWNYFTGSRGHLGYYQDAVDYPDVSIMRTHTIVPDFNYYSMQPPEPLGSNYIVVENLGGLKGIFTFELDGNPSASWGVAYIVDYGADNYFDTISTAFSNGEGKAYVPYFEDTQRIILIPGVTCNYGQVYNFYYDIYIRPPGDADGNHLINIADITYIIGFVFGGGPASHPFAAMDANCDHMVNISDVVVLIQYIFGGGPFPCQ
ncbi:MAG: hypothetical protein KAT58_07305 [candidate division Zixibacteria bacterium]|nr:hypothetical protein [candidate division Zixibacteria bacterium]